jgi:hypothetical protein
MRRLGLVGLLATICLAALPGCGKEPPPEKPQPMLKGRMPRATSEQPKPKAP